MTNEKTPLERTGKQTIIFFGNFRFHFLNIGSIDAIILSIINPINIEVLL